MSESAVGLMDPATRQKAGMSLIAELAGGLKVPAATDSAVPMETPASASFDKSSHVAPAAGGMAATNNTKTAASSRFMIFLQTGVRPSYQSAFVGRVSSFTRSVIENAASPIPVMI